MMFRQPIAMVAPLLRVLREIDRVSESQRGIAAVNDRREIEERIKNHPLV
jgi:hypothetical protein